jgi:hypothetical protein
VKEQVNKTIVDADIDEDIHEPTHLLEESRVFLIESRLDSLESEHATKKRSACIQICSIVDLNCNEQ